MFDLASHHAFQSQSRSVRPQSVMSARSGPPRRRPVRLTVPPLLAPQATNQPSSSIIPGSSSQNPASLRDNDGRPSLQRNPTSGTVYGITVEPPVRLVRVPSLWTKLTELLFSHVRQLKGQTLRVHFKRISSAQIWLMLPAYLQWHIPFGTMVLLVQGILWRLIYSSLPTSPAIHKLLPCHPMLQWLKPRHALSLQLTTFAQILSLLTCLRMLLLAQ